jgi:hypothetical protein
LNAATQQPTRLLLARWLSPTQELSSVAGAFYMRLFYHFSTHFDGKHLDRVSFKKRYDDICLDGWVVSPS